MPGITKKTSATSLTITINIIITTAIIKQQQLLLVELLLRSRADRFSGPRSKKRFFSDGWFPLHGLGILLAVTRTLTRTLSYIVISILLARLVLPLFSSKA